METIEYADGVYLIYFPTSIMGEPEERIFDWIREREPAVRMSPAAPFVEFENEDDALMFRLTFGL